MTDMEWFLHHFDTVDSTNQVAFDFPPYSVISADHQMCGRGRYGRVWEGVDGNLYMSVVLPDLNALNPFLSFGTGVAVARALSHFNVRLKWPNDLLKEDKKVGGILIERVEDKVIVGIGVNVVGCPTENMIYPVTSLEGKITKEVLQQRILDNLADVLNKMETDGFAPVRAEWLTLSALQEGDEIGVRLPNKRLSGRFKGIDDNGILKMETMDGLILISAGDVFHL